MPSFETTDKLQFGNCNYVHNVQKSMICDTLSQEIQRKRQKQPFVSWTAAAAAAAAHHKLGSDSCSNVHGQLKKTWILSQLTV